MKVAIPVDDMSLDTNICISFGRTPYFLIYDTETKDAMFLDNSAAAIQGGAGIKAAQTVADSNAEALLTPRCGENAAEVIRAADIKIYQTKGNLLKHNLQAFEAGELELLEEIHAGFHGGK
jgi:predicted Fe-Mo cluster-binding NifX family protein